MRVLYFSDNRTEHNRRFLEKLGQSGHEIWFLSCGDDRTARSDWLPRGVQQLQPKQTFPRDTGPSRFQGFVPEFQELLQRLQPDLVHAGPVQSTGYIAALAGFHPLLVMSWGADILLHAERNAEWQQATAVALKAADGFFCDCNAVRTAAGRFANFSDAQTVQFPWGIERGSFDSAGPLPAKEKFSPEPGVKYFISTRSWEPIYEINILLEAFHQAHRRDGRVRLLLLGKGSQAKNIRDFIAGHDLEKVVLTPGVIEREELPQWFRAAQGYISCAQSDGTSVSLLEAMATGLPVVVTDIPSNREWVNHGHNGWLAPVGSSADFADGLLKMASLGVQERERISEANRQMVAERADWDKNFPRLLELYRRLAERPRNKDYATLIEETRG